MIDCMIFPYCSRHGNDLAGLVNLPRLAPRFEWIACVQRFEMRRWLVLPEKLNLLDERIAILHQAMRAKAPLNA
jgi:hypothetical protein